VGTVSTGEAMRLLGTSRPTIISLIEHGHLRAGRVQRGKRFAWRIEAESLQAYVAAHGRFDGRRPSTSSRLTLLEREVADLRAAVRGMTTRAEADRGPGDEARREDDSDDLRARVVALEEALARVRNVAELQRQADKHRSEMVNYLLIATAANEKADQSRQLAISELEEALAGFTQPGHLGDIA